MRFCKSSRAWGSPIDWGFFDGTNASIFNSAPMAKSTRSGLKSAPSNMMPRGIASTRDSSHKSAQRWPLPPAWKPPPPLPKPPDPQPPKPWKATAPPGLKPRRRRSAKATNAVKGGNAALGKPGCVGTAPPQATSFMMVRVAANGLTMCGWGTWIRTKIDGVRVRSSTVELSPNGRSRGESSRGRQRRQ